MKIHDPRISNPHPHRSGHRCEVKTHSGAWKHGPTRPTEEAARAAAAEKLAALDTEQQEASAADALAADPDPDLAPQQEKDTPTQDSEPVKKEDPPQGVPDGVRILGPYREVGRWRCQIKIGTEQRPGPMEGTEKEAVRSAKRMALDLARQGGITVGAAIDAIVAHKGREGARAATLAGTRRGLTLFWAGMLDSPIGRITERTAQAQYDKLREWIDPRSGRALSVDTHRSYLKQAKMLARWCVKRSWLRGPSPVDGVAGVGKKRRGKPQLSWDEGTRLGAVCIIEASEASAAVLMAMLMGLRASEVLSRVVRDIDRNGTHLRIDDNDDVAFRVKNDSSRRPVKISELIQPLLAKLNAGKAPTDPIFPGTLGGRRRRQWLHVEVRRLCRKAGVPVVCPHSLRGWMTSTAVAAGELPEVVAKRIGHTSAQMTLQHYIAPGVAEAAALARGQAAFAAALPTLPS